MLLSHDDLYDDRPSQPSYAVRRLTASALTTKAGELAQRGQHDAARATRDAVLTRFAHDPDPEVQAAVTAAREGQEGSST